MSEQAAERSVHTMSSYPGAIPEIGVWLWAMQEARRNLLKTVGEVERAGFDQRFIDWQGTDGNDNSVGTLLYHIARLAQTRRRFLDIVSAMSAVEWDELRSPPGEHYTISMSWTVYHLVEHEAGHLYEIRRIVRKWREGPAVG